MLMVVACEALVTPFCRQIQHMRGAERARLREHTRQEQHKRGESRFQGRWIKGILVAAHFAASLLALTSDVTAKSYIQAQNCSGGLCKSLSAEQSFLLDCDGGRGSSSGLGGGGTRSALNTTARS